MKITINIVEKEDEKLYWYKIQLKKV